MLKTNINKNNEKQIIEATGSIPELMNDVAVVLSAIHNQLEAVSPAAAVFFKRGIERMIKDPKGKVWTASGNQTGITFRMPEKKEDEE